MTLTRLLLVFSLFVALIVALAGCGGTPPPPVTSETAPAAIDVVARADYGYTMTLAQLFDKVSASRLYESGGVMPTSEVKDFLDNELIDTLAGFYADSVNLDTCYDYRRTYRRRLNEFLVGEYVERRINDQVHVDSQQVVDFYNENKAMFKRPAQVLLYHIYAAWAGLISGPDSLYYRGVSPLNQSAEVKKYIDHVATLLDAGMPFKEAAATYSQDTRTVKDSGFVGWVKQGVYQDPFDSIAFSMKAGTYSQPYVSDNGWHIIYIAKSDTAAIAPLDSVVFPQIMSHLQSQEAEKLARPLIDSLDQEIHLVYNEPLLDSSVYSVDRQTWAGILNDRDTIDFNDLRALEERYRKQYGVDNTSGDLRRQMIHDVARHFIVVQAARAAGIDTLEAARVKEATLRHQYSKSVVLLNVSPTGWTPSDSMIAAYYEKHMAQFDIEKPLRVQQIVSDDSTFALFLRDQALAGVDFLELARQYYPGEESIRESLADLGWIGPNDVSPEFFEAAQVLPIGGVSMPVHTKYGYHIIKLLERKQKMNEGQARAEIVPILKQQHEREVRDRFRDKLYAMYNVRFPNRLPPFDLKPALKRRQEAAGIKEPPPADAAQLEAEDQE